MLKGERVILRPVRRSDITFFLKWFDDPEVIQFLMWHLPMTEMSEEKWIEGLGQRTQHTAHFVIESIEAGSGGPIGNLQLGEINNKDRNAHFGIMIGEKAYWSQGYGTEAARLLLEYGFQQLNLHRISSSVFAFNQRSLRMHRNVGFQEEGRRRQAVFKNGQYTDLVCFGLLNEEWKP